MWKESCEVIHVWRGSAQVCMFTFPVYVFNFLPVFLFFLELAENKILNSLSDLSLIDMEGRAETNLRVHFIHLPFQNWSAKA